MTQPASEPNTPPATPPKPPASASRLPAPRPITRPVSRGTGPAAAAAAPVQKQRSERMRPAAAIPTLEERPNRLHVYGMPGIGKSTLASKFPAPIFMAFDDGQYKIAGAKKFPVKPESFSEVLDGIHFLETDEHKYQTLVFDLIEGIEPLIYKQVVAERVNSKGSKVRSIDEFGFQDGYRMAVDYWRTFTTALERMQRARNIEVIFLSHEVTRSVKNPNGEDYMRAEPNVHRNAVDYLYGWTDYVLQATKEVYTTTSRNRVKGHSDGVHILRSAGQPAYVAKRRTALPDPLELDGDLLYELMHSTASMVEPLLAEIHELAAQVDEAVSAKVLAALEQAGDDTNELSRIRGKLESIVAMNTPADAGTTEPTEQGE